MSAAGARGRVAAAGLVVLLVAAAGAWWLSARRAHEVDVFFVRFDAGHHRAALVAVRRAAPAGPVERQLEAALHALLAGPPRRAEEDGGAPLVTEIPAGTTLRGVRVAGGTATVDLSSRYAAGGGSTSMQARVWQVVYTATQFPEARAAEILIEGRRVDSLGGEGVPIGGPLERSRAPAWF